MQTFFKLSSFVSQKKELYTDFEPHEGELNHFWVKYPLDNIIINLNINYNNCELCKNQINMQLTSESHSIWCLFKEECNKIIKH